MKKIVKMPPQKQAQPPTIAWNTGVSGEEPGQGQGLDMVTKDLINGQFDSLSLNWHPGTKIYNNGCRICVQISKFSDLGHKLSPKKLHCTAEKYPQYISIYDH